MQVTIIGAGGFRTPLLYRSLLDARERLGISEVVLHDSDAGRMGVIQPVLAGIAQERGETVPLRLETDLDDAVRGAAFVLCAIRVGGLEGRIIDETVPLEHGVLGQETVGPGGISFALRTLPAMNEIALSIARNAPDAWLINFTNPAGMITESLQRVLGERAVGICDSPEHIGHEIAATLGVPEGELVIDYAGLNHLGWVYAARRAGHDLLPGLLADDELIARMPTADLFGRERLRELGMVPNEYLFYFEHPEQAVEGFQRAGQTRAQVLAENQLGFYEALPGSPREAARAWRRTTHARNRSYMAEVRESDADEPLEGDDEQPVGGYDAAALQVMDALSGTEPTVLILNVANRGALTFLDRDAVVEVPSVVDRGGITPLARGDLPEQAHPLITQIKQVERLTIEAAASGSRSLAVAALALHPLVPSPAVAQQIFAGYMERQPLLAAVLTKD